MKKVGLLALLAILTLAVGNSEIVAIRPSSSPSSGPQTFFDAIGGRGLDFAYSITQPKEGDPFAVVGPWDYTGVFDAFIAKLDSSGSIQWARALGEPRGIDTSLAVIETSDGGYVMAGETSLRAGGGGDLFIAKFSSNGSYQWGTAVGGDGWERALSVIETRIGTQDHGFVVTGSTTSFGAAGWDLFITKFNSSGELQWAKRLGGAGNEVGSSVIEIRGNLFITGWTTSFGTMDILLARFRPDGSLLWANAFGAERQDDAGDSLCCRDRGSDLFVTGWTKGFGAGNQDVFIAKFDLEGNVIWAKTLGGTYDDRGHSVIVTPPHLAALLPFLAQVTVTGSTKSFGTGGEDVLLAAFGLDGNFKWARTVGGPDDEGGFSVKQALVFGLPVSRLFVAGYTYSWGIRQDALLATFDPYGYTYPPVNVVHKPTVGNIPIQQLSRGSISTDAVEVNPSVFRIPQAVIYEPNLSRTQLRYPPLVKYTDVGPPMNPVAFSFAIIADNHLHHTTTLPTVIRWIKANKTSEDIRFVVLLGDITDETKGPDGRRYSCVRKHLEDVRDLLETLEVPYIPVIGNHDVWYDDGNDNQQSWWEKRPEEIFNEVFGPHIDNLPNLLPRLSNWTKAQTPIVARPPTQNAPEQVKNYFQNFAFDYEGYHFIFLDFVSRTDPYTSNEADIMKRGWPDLQRWAPGGTWDWFTRHLDNYVRTSTASENILIFTHHPLSFSSARLSLSDLFPLAFRREDYKTIVDYFANNGYHQKLAKWFAGHLHIPLEEDINDNRGNLILQTVITAAVSEWAPHPLKRNPYAPALRVVRVRSR